MRRSLLAFGLLIATSPALAGMVAKPVEWTVGKDRFSGFLVYDDAKTDARPGLVMVPNWMGVTDTAVARAKTIAGDDYVVLVADVYGKEVRPKDAKEALAAVQKVYDDGGLRLRERANAAVATLKAQSVSVPFDTAKIAAFGFCFGGSVALELARSGADVAGVVSFHGGIERYRPGADAIKASVLVLNGADDASVTGEQVLAFREEMKAAKADWQFVDLGGAVHCFTQEESRDPPNCLYDERASKRAFEMMDNFLDERFGSAD